MSHEHDGAMLSFGAGVNSTALAILLINEGWKGPLVFADTGCEWPETYDFMAMFEQEWLKQRGFEVVRISPSLTPQFYRESDAGMTVLTYCERRRMVPLAHRRWCTVRFKIKPLEKWQEANKCPSKLLGIASDEARRSKGFTRPLVDRQIGRKECKEIIAYAGLPVPPKSGCYICPMQKVSEWRKLWRLHPDLFARAMALEENAVAKHRAAGAWPKSLDPSGKTMLRQRLLGFESQIEMGLWPA